MNRNLRKRHLHIWVILALLLPLGFIWAYQVIPSTESSPSLLPTGSSLSDELFLVSLTAGSNKAPKLEISIQQPLSTPSTLVYLTSKSSPEIEQAILIGALGPKGVYHFDLPRQIPDDPLILFYDAINQQMYHQIAIP